MKKLLSLSNKNIFKFYSYANSDVFFLKKREVINKKNITDLISIGLQKKKDLKICMHSNVNQKLHNMINFLYKKICYFPHSHNSDEIYQFVKGDLKIFIFNNNCKIVDTLYLSNWQPIIRVLKNTFHVTIPVKNFSVFHEIKEGPFQKRNTVFLKKSFIGNSLIS